jgi:hypothetical protein
MKTICHGFLILSTAALLPALPAAAAGPPPWPAAQQAIPQARESEGPVTTWDPVRFSLSAEVHVGWMLQDDARRLWGKQSLFSEGLSVSYDALRVGGKATLGLDLSWLATVASTTPSSELSQKTSTQVFDLGLTVRYQVFRWLSPYARVAAGMGWAALSIGSSGIDLRDRAFLYQGSAGAGLLFRSAGLRFDRTRSWLQVAFVGRVEGGYTMGNAAAFSLKLRSDGSNNDPIPVEPVSVGEVARRFPYLRISVGVGF